MKRLVLACIPSFLFCFACSSGSNPGTPDKGNQDRKSSFTEGGITDLTGQVDKSTSNKDGTRKDQSSGVCEQQCLDENPLLCVSKNGSCYECLDNSSCQKNPAAVGPKCDYKNTCYCENNNDCASNFRGPTCDTALDTCTCASDSDCTKAPYTVCMDYGWGKICEIPCKSNGDCKDATRPKCDVSSGICYSCLGSADCADSPFGSSCVEHWCHCSSTTHCKGANSLGAQCVTSSLGKICGCEENSDCSGKNFGPICDESTGRCSCTTDGDCTAPYTNCMLPFATAKYLQCQKPCTTKKDCGQDLVCSASGRCVVCSKDSDCTDASLSVCKTDIGVCVECLNDSHCSGDLPACDTASGYCVQCTSGKFCPAERPACEPQQKICVECVGNAECANNAQGAICQQDTFYCGCSTASECTSTSVWGSQCVAAPTGKSCGCAGDATCSGNSHGTICNTQVERCSCWADSQCTVTPYLKCAAAPGDSTSYHAYCQKPCSSTADCANTTDLPTCNTTTGKCVECTKDGDCTGSKVLCNDVVGRCVSCKQDTDCIGWRDKCSPLGKCVDCKSPSDCTGNEWEKICDPLFGCVECTQNSDCGYSSLGNNCNVDVGTCRCKTNADCVNNLNGHICDQTKNVCSCGSVSDCPAGKTCSVSYTGLTTLCSR